MLKNTYTTFLLILFSSVLLAQNNKTFLKKAVTTKDSSDYYFKKAKKAIKNSGDEAEYYFYKNAYCSDYGKSDSTLFYGKIALDKFKVLKEKIKPLYIYSNNTRAYQKKGNYEKAIAESFKGLKFAQETNDEKWQGWYYQNISLNFHDFGQYEKGVYYGKLAYKFLKKNKKDAYSTVLAINAIAINFDDWNKLDSALFYHKKVFEYKKEIDTLQIGFTYNNIGNTLLKQKKYKEAKPWVLNAIKIAKTNFNGVENDEYFYENATNYTNLARVYSELKDFSAAEKNMAIAYPFVKKSKSVEKLRDYYESQYLLYKYQNKFEKALEFKELYYQIKDSVFQKENAKIISESETKFQVAQKEKRVVELEAKDKERNLWLVLISIIAIGFALIGYLFFRQQKLKNKQQNQEFELKNAIASIETQNKLNEQRLSISRDLHDNIGAQLTFIISSVDNLKFANTITDNKITNQLNKISDFTKATIVELRDTIWAMNSNEFTFEDLRSRIFNFIEKAKAAKSEIDFKFTIDEKLKEIKLSSLVGINLYRTIQETINNSVKHSDGNLIAVEILDTNNQIKIEVSDNGKGFNLESIEFGNGLHNMKKRIEEVNGVFQIHSEPNKGTKTTFLLPKYK